MNQDLSPSADSNLHHVIAAPGSDIEPGKLSKILAPALGRVPFDETYRLKNCGGWWLRGGDKEMSSKVLEACQSLGLHAREWVQELSLTRLKVRRTIRTRLEDDRIELITPTDSRWIPLSSIRAIDVSLAAEDDDPENENLTQQRERVTRSLAEVMLPGTPAGDLLEKISEAPIQNPRPRLFLLGQEDLCWSMDRSTVFLDLVQQRAAQSLANILRFTGLLTGSVSEEVVTPQTQSFWIDGTLDKIRRDMDTHQANRIEAIRGWLEAGGKLHDHVTNGKSSDVSHQPLPTKGQLPS
ncbi:MAG: hypothetical protein CBC13_10040 [Planctomycetia bacterium TMED53]|nr:MAG: hypothetical protein CBC13_10040 [Planctomycetia bacterium TMED53]